MCVGLGKREFHFCGVWAIANLLVADILAGVGRSA